ncbi:hypothetical protein [Maribellus maritimus]|uniref:hypothetical protein n=1 Tax=Maribellus maritimus TaxID=2870838 RepID=UPI001EEA91FE|nr:hypothetical protein [Maribellus maritimus]
MLKNIHHGYKRFYSLKNYSYLSASTGFLVAARQLCQLTVSNAIPSDITPASKNPPA